MEKNKEKELDVFLSEAIQGVELESPSLDFTKNLFAKIEEKQAKKAVFVYKPVIARPVWVIIFFFFLGLLGYAFTGNIHSNMDWWPNISLDVNFTMKNLPQIYISKTYMYCFVGLSFFLALQVYLIKQHHNKRFSLE